MVPGNTKFYVVRRFNPPTGWIDVSNPVSRGAAAALWAKKTKNGTKNTMPLDRKYYRIFWSLPRTLLPRYLER